MTKQENPNFKASRFAPNPQEVAYWIDLTADPNQEKQTTQQLMLNFLQ